ncbi:MAG TPA: MFS transporter, partial [Fimbriimonadaceae bacterium]|nr:MFS transporter [Fimbriimonadaceae bacterium]
MKQIDRPPTARAAVEYQRPAPQVKSPWYAVTVAIMIVGYAGYYLCRSDLSVARPLIIDQYKSIGITKAFIGDFTALATLFYAGGKFLFGSTADVVGGKRMFMLGMAGAIAFSILFGVGGPPLFLLAWCGNRFIQSSGWVGMVKVTSRWFGHSTYGTVMGLISLSFLFGDFASRQFLGFLIDRGWGWQQIFYISAGVLACIFIPSLFLMKEKPSDRNLPEPESNPDSVFAVHDADAQKKSLKELILPLFTSPSFWVVCLLSFGFTFMRETFNDWTPTFLHEVAKMSEGDAAKASSYFPLFGGISVIGVGYLSDRLKRGSRAAFIAIGLALSTAGLLFLAYGNFGGDSTLYVAVVAALAFVLIGPYSFLAGA